jgi:serine/threonine-protein kinase RsbW
MSMQFRAERDQLPEMLAWVEKQAGSSLNPTALNKVRLACEEMLVNIIDYAYEGHNQPRAIEIDCLPQSNAVEITIRDSGAAFNPIEMPAPDVNAPPQERRVGGLGIYLAKHLMDSMEYDRQGNLNILKLKKTVDGD